MTTTIRAEEIGDLPENLADRRGNGWWGMVCFVGSESTLFSALIAGYLYVRLNSLAWPPPGFEPHSLVLPAINTGVLVASSLVLIAAERDLKHECWVRGRLLMAGTSLMGLVFLALQVEEWREKAFAVSDGAYGAAFYTITGAHGAHVIIGLLLLVLLQVRMFDGHERSRPWYGMHPISLYWHFVDAVWLVVFSVLYLSERL
jgi:heme/copper-type cytochrome/quinol oxidase subunit 3